MEPIKAGLVIASKFVVFDNKKYREYIDYIDRDEAVRAEHAEKYDAYIDSYMDNRRKVVSQDVMEHEVCTPPEKVSALFTAAEDKLMPEEKAALKKQFAKAQENKSPMCQTVISFDNHFLEAVGMD